MQDPYATLGITKTATDKEIRDAFKKLTRKFHPDLHPGDASAEEKFKQISVANDLLGDPDKRRRFDAGEIDATGAERPRETFYRDFAEAPAYGGGHAAQDGFANEADLEDFLSRAFGGAAGSGGFGGFASGMGGMGGMGGGGGGGRRGSRADFSAKGQDVTYALPVDFLDAVNGAKRTITLPDGKVLNVTIPEGAEDRQMLRLRGQGGPGFNGGAAGDAYVELHIEPHAFFQRRDNDIHVEVPVTLKEAVLGAKIEVPTIGGPVTLTVPKGSNTGRTLRLREKGVLDRRSKTRGHQLVTLKVVLPTGEEPDLSAFLEGWTPRHPQNPRKEMLP